VLHFAPIFLVVLISVWILNCPIFNLFFQLQPQVCDLIEQEMLLDILEPEIRGSCILSEVVCAINIALLCVQHRPEARPSMSQIVTLLSGDINIEGFVAKSSNLGSDLKDLSGTIDRDINYPSLKRLAKDESIYPRMNLTSHSSDIRPPSPSSNPSLQPETDASASIELSPVKSGR
jgi:hypothetical protein